MTALASVPRPQNPRIRPIPQPSAKPQEPMPRTSPERPWDRLSVSARVREVLPTFDEEVNLRDPLPEDAPSGKKFIGPIVLSAVEILRGHRAPGTLRHWLAPEVYATLVRRAGLAMRIQGRAPRSAPPRIVRILTSEPAPRVIEAALAIHDGKRVRAACMRLEFANTRWKVVSLEIG